MSDRGYVEKLKARIRQLEGEPYVFSGENLTFEMACVPPKFNTEITPEMVSAAEEAIGAVLIEQMGHTRWWSELGGYTTTRRLAEVALVAALDRADSLTPDANEAQT